MTNKFSELSDAIKLDTSKDGPINIYRLSKDDYNTILDALRIASSILEQPKIEYMSADMPDDKDH